jgi:hypothetical protein
MVQVAAATETNAPPNGLKAAEGERTLGSPLREIRTMGSERGDGHKRPRGYQGPSLPTNVIRQRLANAALVTAVISDPIVFRW